MVQLLYRVRSGWLEREVNLVLAGFASYQAASDTVRPCGLAQGTGSYLRLGVFAQGGGSRLSLPLPDRDSFFIPFSLRYKGRVCSGGNHFVRRTDSLPAAHVLMRHPPFVVI